MKNNQANRIAAIDMGTNSFHLVIVEVKKDGSFHFLDREREVIRLGTQQGKDLSFISEEEMDRSIKIVNNFVKLAKHYNAQIKAIATSAVREAKNQKDFIDVIFMKTGVSVEVVDGKTEAELDFLGIQKAVPISNSKVLCIDIGGGSTEFIYAVNGKKVYTESVKVGAVRLSKLFFPNYIISDELISKAMLFVEEQILGNKNILTNIDIDFSIGVSGTVNTIYALSQFRKYKKIKDPINEYSFSNKELQEYFEIISKLKTSAERTLVPGIDTKRSDIIPAGMVILKKIFDLFNLKKMVVSEYSLREGIVVDSIAKMINK
jgi:exopolyphosphatase/guanosine-5'-triphosphate,3'-diphosphate pyrophosphatase